MLDVAHFLATFADPMAIGFHPRRIDLVRRAIAAGCAGLVFVVGLLAVSPALHRHLHSHAGTATDAGCVIVQFTNGVSVPCAAVPVAPCLREWTEQPYASFAEASWSSPRYLHLPGRGPPAA